MLKRGILGVSLGNEETRGSVLSRAAAAPRRSCLALLIPMGDAIRNKPRRNCGANDTTRQLRARRERSHRIRIAEPIAITKASATMHEEKSKSRREKARNVTFSVQRSVRGIRARAGRPRVRKIESTRQNAHRSLFVIRSNDQSTRGNGISVIRYG